MPENKLTAVRLKQLDGTYGEQIPVGATTENILYSDTEYTLDEILGTVDISAGSLQHQIDNIKQTVNNGYVTPEEFGAAGDGSADDTTAFNECVTYCAHNNYCLYIKPGSEIRIPEYQTFSGLRQIKAEGLITAPNGIEFRFNSNTSGAFPINWYFNRIKDGNLVLSGLKDGLITVNRLTDGDLILLADGQYKQIDSLAYNQFYLGHIRGVILRGIHNGYQRTQSGETVTGKGWITENYFYGGNIKYLTLEYNEQTVDGYVTTTYSYNHNHFYHNTFENESEILFQCGRSNYIHDARFEGTNTITFQPRAAGNFVHQSYIDMSLPGTNMESPGSINDITFDDKSHSNYFTTGVIPFIKQYSKIYDINSYNYNANKLYPIIPDELTPSVKKIHNTAASGETGVILETELIDISKHALGTYVLSDQTFFRGHIYIYDANKELITTQPTKSPFYGAISMSWDNTNTRYLFSNTHRKYQKFSANRYDFQTGEDTGVYYFKLRISGSGTTNFDYLKCIITTPYYIDISPFKQNKLTATSIPTNGVWEDGLIAYNIDPSNHCLGWFYNNEAWHEIGTYTVT